MLAKTLAERLDKSLTVPPDLEDAPPLEFGAYTLRDNDGLLLDLANEAARTTGAIPDFAAFQKLFQSKPDRPIPPDPDDPKFDPPHIEYDTPLERQVAKLMRYDQAKQDHDKRDENYQQIQARSRAITQTYNPTVVRYFDYVVDTVSRDDPAFAQDFFFASRPLPVSEDSRRAHTFLSGATKSGKSETIKYLIRHYLTKNTRPALAVFDPHGKLAKEVSEMREFAKTDRLVFVAPSMFEGARISLNPFDCRDKSETGLNTQARQLMGALERVLGSMTDPAKGIMPHCLSLLLHRDGSTLNDLLTLMDDDNNDELVKYGAQRLPFAGSRAFFADQFKTSRHYDSTKESLRNRLQILLSSPIISRFLCEESTFDLEGAIDEGKVIVFNFTRSKMDAAEVQNIGQLVMARIQGYCLTRELIKGNPLTPVHVFADECQYFVNPTVKEILGENRKHGLHLTLATQRTDQMAEVGSAKLVDAVIGNVGVFITGRGGGNTPEKLSPEIKMKPEEIRDLKPLNFLYTEKASAVPRPTIQTAIPYIGRQYRMSADDWGLTISDQIKRHYRPLNAPNKPSEVAEAEQHPPAPLRDPNAPLFDFPALPTRKHSPIKK